MAKQDSPQILHEIANGTCDFFLFVQGERYDGLTSITLASAFLSTLPQSISHRLEIELKCTYDETDGDPLPCRDAMRGL